jgi:hypothetical protein
MTKCNPYHTTTEEEPKQRDVYHNYKECPDGMRIKPENKKDGTDGRPRCDECIALD